MTELDKNTQPQNEEEKSSKTAEREYLPEEAYLPQAMGPQQKLVNLRPPINIVYKSKKDGGDLNFPDQNKMDEIIKNNGGMVLTSDAGKDLKGNRFTQKSDSGFSTPRNTDANIDGSILYGSIGENEVKRAEKISGRISQYIQEKWAAVKNLF